MTENTTDFWAIVELMGHRRLAGKVSEVEMFGTTLLRLDVPGTPGSTQFYGGSSIYCLTPVSEDLARSLAQRYQPALVQRWELPAPDGETETEMPF